jgi:hypothetical protein
VVSRPLPSFPVPVQTARALRIMMLLLCWGAGA